MKIGIFTDGYKPAISGVVTSIDSLKNGLEALGHSVIIVTVKPVGADKKKVNYEEEAGKVIRFGGLKIPKKDLAQYRFSFFKRKKLKRLKSENFDIIHVHTEFSIGNLGRLLSKKQNIPMVYTFHTMYEDYLYFISKFLANHAKKSMVKILKKLITAYAKQASAIILPTEKVKEVFVRYNLDSQPLHIIPTGINIERFYPENVDQGIVMKRKKELKIGDNDFCYLFLGRISKEKSIDVVIEEFNKIHKSIPNAKLLIAGGGPMEDHLHHLVANLGLNDKIIFTGMIEPVDVPVYYQIGDVFINASITETQGLTYIEALAATLPLIVSDDLALKEVVTEEFNGYLAKQKTDFHQLMLKIYEEKEKFQQMKKNTRDSVEKYSDTCYTNNVLELYYSILNKG